MALCCAGMASLPLITSCGGTSEGETTLDSTESPTSLDGKTFDGKAFTANNTLNSRDFVFTQTNVNFDRFTYRVEIVDGLTFVREEIITKTTGTYVYSKSGTNTGTLTIDSGVEVYDLRLIFNGDQVNASGTVKAQLGNPSSVKGNFMVK